MVSALISRALVLTLGTLYPAYRSYKGVKSRNVREYVKWMMYWIVFAIYLCVEALADIFVAFWLPLYYEIKIIFIIWLLSPYTKGASLLYRKFVHPFLLKHERDIDLYLEKAKRESYARVMKLGNRGINYAKEAVAMAALRGHEHIVGQVRKTVSLNDVSDGNSNSLDLIPGGNKRLPALQYDGLDEEDDEDQIDNAGGPFHQTAAGKMTAPANIMVSSLRVKRVKSVKQRPALAEVTRRQGKPPTKMQNPNQPPVLDPEIFDDVDSNLLANSSTSSNSNYQQQQQQQHDPNGLITSQEVLMSDVVDQEFGYLEGEEVDQNEEDFDETAEDAALNHSQVYKNEDDPDYSPSLHQQKKPTKNNNANYATLPRRSQRKVVKKE